MVIVPLTLGVLIATFAPGAEQFFGSFTGALVAAANPAYAKAAPYATVLVAASVVVTMLTVPLITAWWAKKIGQRGGISP